MLFMMKDLGSAEYKEMGVDEMTVLAQGVVNLVAAYDPVTSALVFTSYYLAKHPDKQAKLLRAIDSYVPEDEIIKIPYLAACIREALRLAPPFFRPERICTKDWEGLGMKIKKGSPIVIPAWVISGRHFRNQTRFFPKDLSITRNRLGVRTLHLETVHGLVRATELSSNTGRKQSIKY